MSATTKAVRSEPCCGCRILGRGTLESPLRIRYCPVHGSAEKLLAACKLAVNAFEPLPIEDGWDWADETLKAVGRAYHRGQENQL